MDFDGTSGEYIETYMAGAINGDMTIMAWVNNDDSTEGQQTIMGAWDAGGPASSFRFNLDGSNDIEFWIYNGTYANNNWYNLNVPYDTWTHVAVTYN